jgi:hypothetical protein
MAKKAKKEIDGKRKVKTDKKVKEESLNGWSKVKY